MKDATLRMLLGAIAGAIVWVLMEPLAPRDPFSPEWGPYSMRVVMVLGASIGLILGGYAGWRRGGKVHLLLGAVLGAILGSSGAYLGAGLGDRLVAMIIGPASNDIENPVGGLARLLSLSILGSFLGLGIGLSTLKVRRAVQGLIGGTLGGIAGSIAFIAAGFIFAAVIIGARGSGNGEQEVGLFSRAAYYILLGGFVGLFIGMVEQAQRVAWLRLAVGRNEGREWPVDEARTFIGRSEMAQVPIFGDPAIAPVHASITRQGEHYFLADNGSQTGTFLNGYPVAQPVPLFHGALIRVGNSQLEFLMKVGSAPQRAAETMRAQQHFLLAGSGQAAAYPAAAAMPAYGAPAAAAAPQPFVGSPVPGQPVQTAYPAPGGFVAPASAQPSQPTVAVSAYGPTSHHSELIAVSGPLTGRRFSVDGLVEAGREASGIPLSFDNGASRRHASFAPAPAGIVVNDLGSTNGTFVNDQRVQSATLNKGDLVRIGVTVFKVE